MTTGLTQASIQKTVCMPGWTASVRPSASFTGGIKRRMLRQAGLKPSEGANYELDRFVPLALGGHPRSLENLWLQPWAGEWSAKHKDRLERSLQVAVCAGKVSLSAARALFGQQSAKWNFPFSSPATRVAVVTA
jgi:hypothetical protein